MWFNGVEEEDVKLTKMTPDKARELAEAYPKLDAQGRAAMRRKHATDLPDSQMMAEAAFYNALIAASNRASTRDQIRAHARGCADKSMNPHRGVDAKREEHWDRAWEEAHG